MPSQRSGRPVNQTVANNYQQVIVSGRRNSVQCLHCHWQMTNVEAIEAVRSRRSSCPIRNIVPDRNIVVVVH